MKPDSKKILLDFRNVDIDRWGENHREIVSYPTIDSDISTQYAAVIELNEKLLEEFSRIFKIPKGYILTS